MAGKRWSDEELCLFDDLFIAALEQLSDHDRLQIEQASNGCCSGTLAEWPDLRASLDKLRIVLPGDTGSSTVMLVCWLIQTRKDSQ